jgi:hypothetical protein
MNGIHRPPTGGASVTARVASEATHFRFDAARSSDDAVAHPQHKVTLTAAIMRCHDGRSSVIRRFDVRHALVIVSSLRSPHVIA